MGTAASERSATYYTKGSEEAAVVTPLTLQRLEHRQNLTQDSKRLVIALVGLPARGKSFVSRKLQAFLTWSGINCKVFNVGKYRREAVLHMMNKRQTSGVLGGDDDGHCNADFFDAKNEKASELRAYVAELALRDMLRWLDNEPESNGESSEPSSPVGSSPSRRWRKGHDRIAIFDATNSTAKRRRWILEECTSPEKRAGKTTGVVFVESICDDEALLGENYKFKVKNSPDFEGMDLESAIADLKQRVRKYEEQYETLTDQSQSYIKIFNLSTRLMVNHIYGRMAKTIVPALMAWNIGTRPIFLSRSGRVPDMIKTDENDSENSMLDLSSHTKKKLLNKGDGLGGSGLQYRDALCEFFGQEGKTFMKERLEKASSPSLRTGTSQTGLGTLENDDLPFPARILTSVMPRAIETALWDSLPVPIETISNLNPLDKGDFAGMELDEVQKQDPRFYSRLESDPYNTRFPGGESYCDLISRLETVVIDIEQQVAPVLVVSHVSCLQALIAYFRNSPVEQCMSIEVPMHTVIKFTPSRGGGWIESRHVLVEEPENAGAAVINVGSVPGNLLSMANHQPNTPIWGDHKSKNESPPPSLPCL
eukprot:CAMPEP_0194045456 /NCGR_PEP_ID=MMETSP0009_2-20130614/16795_1 /TAXON_ID=210454 /ORGANISM="Grammatophora oceanica, Strain CCMP 410" /LENGTH=593 /DNA_ID=CAMNT_0038690319 /DNA_START=16 /DNA_END=1797 /DNA_ORIENTATION=+